MVLNYRIKDNLIIFGAGNYGHLAAAFFPQIKCYIDNDINKQKKGFEGHTVISMHEACHKYLNETIIIAVAQPEASIVRQNLISKGFKDVQGLDELLWKHSSDVNKNPQLNGEHAGYDYQIILQELLHSNCRTEWFYHLAVWENYCCKYLVEPIRGIIEKYIKKDNVIADFGAGYGFWSLFFAKNGYRVSCLELDKKRIEILHSLQKTENRLSVIETNICTTNEGTDVYDAVFCANTLHVIPDWKNVIAEMVRITKSKGFLVFVATNPHSPRIQKDYAGGDILQHDCTLENIEAMIHGTLVEQVEIRQGADEIPSHYILVFQK